MDCTRLEYIKNVNDERDIWAYKIYPVGVSATARNIKYPPVES